MLALLDALHQLQRGAEALLHVIAHFAVGGVAGQQPAVDGAQPKLRHVVFVHEDLPAVVHLAEVDVRLDQPRLGLVVAQAGTRIQAADHVHGALHQLDRAIQGARHFLELVALQQLRQGSFRALLLLFACRQRTLGHAFGNDLLRQGILRIERAQLDQQALAQVARAHAQRIELLHHGQRLFHVFHGVVAVLGDLLERGGQIAVFIEVADDHFGDFAHRFIANGHAQLPSQMVGQALAARR